MNIARSPIFKMMSGVAGLVFTAVIPGVFAAAPAATNSTLVVIQTNSEASSQVKFRNGDSLQGSLLAIDAEKQVVWTNPAIFPSLKFPMSDVTRMRLAPPAGALQRTNTFGNCVLRLQGGDQFTGNLVAMDEDKVLLDTWYAGQMTFPRKQVRWLRSVQGGGYIYQGPNGIDGWTISASVEQGVDQAAWGYASGAFFSRQAGGIGRDLKLPDRAALDFDVNWKQSLQLTVTIYTESLQVYRLPTLVGGVIVGGVIVQPNAAVQAQTTTPQPGAGFYAVHLNANGAYLMTVHQNGDVSNSSMEIIPGLEQKSRAHIALRVDKMEKTISLIIDDKLVKTWQEPGEFAGRGTGVRFVQQGVSPITLSHLTVSRWDGKLDTPPTVAASDDIAAKPAASATNDVFQLKNQDSFAGTLQNIRDGALFVKTSFGPMKFPIERVTEIDFATLDKAEPPAPADDAVRAFFSDSEGRVTFQILEWDKGKVTVQSKVFGRAQFDATAFSLIEFVPSK
jgi:hypothetical protein